MQTLTTHGIRITVESFYQPAHSEPHRNRFLHVYNVRIENRNDYPVKLLSRHWHVIEGTGTIKEVKGEGVIGKQPIITAGGFHEYSSYSILATEIGKMHGTYRMARKDGQEFDVAIPGFVLATPAKLN